MSAILLPESILDLWLIAYRSANDSLKSIHIVASTPVWYRLAQSSGIDLDIAIKCASEGSASVQIFDDTFTEDEGSVCRFTIVDSWEDQLTIVAIENKNLK